MTDRELLELAAKAAGYKIVGYCFDLPYDDYYWNGPEYGLFIEGHSGVWNPLESDGDALRLAVRLGISVYPRILHAYVPDDGQGEITVVEEPTVTDLYAATRRAIVRAAAEIGKAMP